MSKDTRSVSSASQSPWERVLEKEQKRVLRILDKKELRKRVPLTPQHIARLEKKGEFPLRVQVGPMRVGWLEHEVDAWIDGLMAKRDTGAAEFLATQVANDDERPLPCTAEQAEAETAVTTESVAAANGSEGGDGTDGDDPNNPSVTIAYVAQMLNCDPRQVDWLEETQRFPCRQELPDGRVGWFARDLEAWERARERASLAE